MLKTYNSKQLNIALVREALGSPIVVSSILSTSLIIYISDNRLEFIPAHLILSIVAMSVLAVLYSQLYYTKKIQLLRNKTREVEAMLQLEIESLEKTIQGVQTTNELKSQFLANMSHELRTPMHAILNFAKISLKKIGIIDDLKLIKYIETIHCSGSRLINIIDNILDISKLESGSTDFDFEEADIEKLVKETLHVCQSYLLDKFINFEFDNQLSNPKACIDEQKINQVLHNLIGNAIKFAPHNGGISILLQEDTIMNEPAITFEISDNGVGIPEDELHTVFDKFVQSSKTASGAGGTGLGLCISKELIEGHNGIITAQNNNQGGATFKFTIPIEAECKQIETITEPIGGQDE